MQVLVKNPFATALPAKNVTASFWSPDCLYMNSDFSMTSLMELTDPLGLSPFLVVDARVGFMLYLLKKGESLCTRGVGSLGAIGAHILSGGALNHSEDQKKIELYAKEYLPHKLEAATEPFDQVLCFNQKSVDVGLWKQLKVGGHYIFGTTEGQLSINPPGKFEAFGRIWPSGMPTEFGWKFNDDMAGLGGLEFAKIKKLS